MKRFYLVNLLLIGLLSALAMGAYAQTTTYSTPGSYAYTVPAGFTSVTIDMMGANGGQGGYGSYSQRGGRGARVVTQLAVTPGQVLQVYVGGAGNSAYGSCSYPTAGGYNGGGNGYYCYGAGGGGASDVRMGGVALANRVVVAGGGGGGSYNCSTVDNERGGDGGGLSGENGYYCSYNTSSYYCYIGQGGTQTNGGAYGTCYSQSTGTGSLGQGGSANSWYYVGGGGGGYYGGGSGGSYAGGGGGSSYANPLYTSGTVYTQGYNTTSGGNGSVTIIGPTITTSTASLAFGTVVVGSCAPVQTFVVSAVNLTSSPVTVTPPTGFQVSTDNLTWSSSLNLTFTPPTLAATTIYVRFCPASYSAFSGNITVSGGAAPTANIAISGTGDFPCSGTPTPGIAAGSPTSAASTTPVNLTVTGAVGSGLNYQWQSSSYPTFGFTNIPAGTSSSYTFTGLTSTTYFRNIVTCPYSGGSAATNTFSVNAVPAAAACIPTCNYATSVCGNGFVVGTAASPFRITGVSGTSITDNSACGSTAYFDKTTTYAPVALAASSTYTLAVGAPTSSYAMGNQIFIDFNNDGNFAASESVGGSNWTGPGGTISSITIPAASALPTPLGTLLRMRVVVAYACCGAPGYPGYPNIPSCTTTAQYYAESRDYAVQIAPPSCLGVPSVGTITPDVSSSCSNFVSNMVLTGLPSSSNISYQWQTSNDNVTWTGVPGATNTYYTTTVTATKYYRNVATCAVGLLTNTTTPVALSKYSPPTISGSTNICIPNTNIFTGSPSGGTWVSSNPSIASVGLGTGVASGVTPGVAVLTYNAPTGCTAFVTVTVNAAPANITGASNVCAGSTTTLSDPTAGGVWSSSAGAFATVGSGTGVVSGIAAGAANISYTLANGCYAASPITINPLPAAISGSSNICVGSTLVLSDATPGGAWSTSSSTAAVVNSLTGAVTANAALPVNIMYTLPTGCMRSLAMTINPLPSPITGTTTVCAGSTTPLGDATSGGVWSSTTPTIASVDASTGVVSGITNGSANIVYSAPGTGCAINTAVSVTGVPTAFNVTVSNGGGYCPGGAGVHVGLNGSNVGINYNLYDATPTLIATLPGTGAALDFGLISTPGTYTIAGSDAGTGCTRNMSGSATVYVATPPNGSYIVGGGGNYCAGGSGVAVTLSNSDVGVNYLLSNGLTTVATMAGTGGPLNFGNQAAGTYTVMAIDALTLCSSSETSSATVNALTPPVVYNVTPTGSAAYCAGGLGIDVQINSSDPGVTYTLYKGTTMVTSMTGGATPLDFGAQFAAGNYTVVGSDGTCSSTMSGSANVIMNPLPVPYAITGGGNYCSGGAGVTIGLSHSDVGFTYQLLDIGGPISSVAGSNSGINFTPLVTAAGTYSVTATDNTTGCSVQMPGSVTVGISMPPNSYPVSALSGSASYCAGGTGVQIGLPSSDAGVNYQLYYGSTPVGTPVAGTGGTVNLGYQTAQGTYTVRATDPATTCSANMSGILNVTINPLPNVYTVSGGGTFCAGGAGSSIILSNSQVGVNYDLYANGTYVTTMSGTGTALTSPPQTTPGNYTIVAVNATTGCQKNMAGSATVTPNPLPAQYSVTGGGSFCSGGAGMHVYLSNSNVGINYQLINGGVVTTLAGTGFRLDFGAQTTGGTYTINAINATTGCSSTMLGGAPVIVNSLPATYTVVAPSGSSYCAGGLGDTIALSSSDLGVNYALMMGTTSVGTSAGTGGTFSFGAYPAGTYNVVATDGTTGCTSNMAGTVTITANPLPMAYNVTGGGDYCASVSGIAVGMSNSSANVLYTMTGTSGSVASMTGTGAAFSFGLQPAGTYTVSGVDAVTGCSNSMTGSAVAIVHPVVVPTISSAATNGDTVCTGSSVTYNTIVTGGGTAPTYHWTVNGTSRPVSSSSFSYSPANGDVVSVTVTSNDMCASPTTATSAHTITVSPMVDPAVTIAASGATTVCQGTSVTLNATPTNGGTAPSYEWRRNGVALVGSSSSFTFNPANGDVVFLAMNSNYPCRTSDIVYSNDITFNVDQPAPPTVVLNADPGTSIARGQGVFFSANVTQVPGTTYGYVWKLNGTVAGSTSSTYTPANALSDHDVVSVTVTGTNSCGAHGTTQTVTMNVNALGVANVNGAGSDIRVIPNPNKGTFTVKGTLAGAVNGDATFEITNMLGQVVYHANATVKNGNIDEQVQMANGLANGMYILNIRSGADNMTFHFVVEQ